MNEGNLSRRGFMQRSLGAMAVAGLPAWYAQESFAADQDNKSAEKKQNGANDRIVMGAIGIGSPQSRGRAIMHDATNQKGVVYVAACDVDSRHLDRAAEDIKKANKVAAPEIAKFKDFRELLANKDINAVTIATPDHWHALVAIAALKAGKDVYCEKPLTLTIAEGQAIVKVVQATGRVFQVGSQQRSDARFRLACELVRNGRIGKISRIETRIGSNPVSPVLPKVDPPKELDWNFWLGPTPMVDYVEMKQGNNILTRCHYEFRWWYDYSGGKITDWGAHHNDIAQWAMGTDNTGPIAVEATGTAPSTDPNSYNCHPDFEITYTYASGTKVVCMSKGENGIHFEGEDGKWIFVSRGTIRASDDKLIKEPLPKDATKLYVSNNHMGNFMNCVRSREKPICNVEVGFRSVSVCHLGGIALRLGKKLKWDPEGQQFDDADANKMLSRPMRGEWKIET